VVSAFQYALSQEVKRQLHAVVGYSSMLETDGGFSGENLEILTNVREAGESMIDLVDRLTSMARLSLEPIAQRGPCDLVEIAGKALDAVQDDADARQITVHADVDGRPFNIWGDSQYLFHSIYNLLENSVKFTPVGGEIGLRLVYAPDGITIMVSDTGPGIPEEELSDLFNRFFHRKPNDDSEGIGLGLEIVRTTIEAHMGTVTAQNRPEGGAEFVVTLPASARAGWAQTAGQPE
jgi:signal transduction histidine kinase